MKGTILDFLKLAAEKPELANELAGLAIRYGFEFSDEVSDEELEAVAGGGAIEATQAEKTAASTGDLIESMKAGSSDAQEQYKLSMSVLQEYQQRQQQTVQKLSST